MPKEATATWPIFTTELKNRKEVAERTMAFQFEKPAGWTFKAGQFIDITLPNAPETDAEGNTRGFSIARHPHRGVRRLLNICWFSTRFRSGAT